MVVSSKTPSICSPARRYQVKPPKQTLAKVGYGVGTAGAVRRTSDGRFTAAQVAAADSGLSGAQCLQRLAESTGRCDTPRTG
jgi:hypothetical protein